MYISSTILILIIIAIGLYDNNQKMKTESRHNDEIAKIREQHSLEWSKNYEDYCAQKEHLKIQIIAATFDCSVSEAKKKYELLCNTYNDTEFFCAESNSERKNVYSKSIKCSIEDSEFEDYISRVLLPIVNKNNYDLDALDIKHWQREFKTREDISIEQKLEQINNYRKKYHPNIAALLSCVEHVIDTRDITDDDTIYSFTNNELIEISKSFNIYFDLDLDEYILENINYTSFCFDEIVKKNYSGLLTVFTICIYLSGIIDIDISPFDLNLAIDDLFYFFPYYNIKDWKNILNSQLINVCIERNISFNETED